MSQNWEDNVFELSHEGETDLQNIKENFACLKSSFSGATFGLTSVPGQLFYDSSTAILGSGLLKVSKQGNDGWLGILALGQESDNGLVWFHGDNMSNQEGWLIDENIVEDRVMALKNHGSGTYTTGRIVPPTSSWVITDFNIIPNHQHTGPNHQHLWYDSRGNNLHDLSGDGGSLANIVKYGSNYRVLWSSTTGSDPSEGPALTDKYTSLDGTGVTGLSGGHTPSNTGAWRIRAQVGIVIYPDI